MERSHSLSSCLGLDSTDCQDARETVYDDRREADNRNTFEEQRRVASQFSTALFKNHRRCTDWIKSDEPPNCGASSQDRRESAASIGDLAAFPGLHRMHRDAV